MTTEQHAWASSQLTNRSQGRTLRAVCACGQDLEFCTREHCPRCGTSLLAHAA